MAPIPFPLLQLANDIGNDYKMLVHDLKNNKNEFAHSPHAANDLLALLEAMRKYILSMLCVIVNSQVY